MAIYYLCPDSDSPSGGIRTIYRHVDILRRNGYEAFVVHERKGFRCTWFSNDTPVMAWSRRSHARNHSLPGRLVRRVARAIREVSLDRPILHLVDAPSFPIRRDDVVVVPGNVGPRLAEIAPGVPKVIFNQGVYHTFRHYPDDPRSIGFPYRHPEVVATIVTSDDGARFMEYVFPGARLHRVRNSVDPVLFSANEEKVLRIAYMPRRNADDGTQVLAILAARGVLDGYEIVPIDGMDEGTTASILRQSLVFLSLAYQEGFGLPPAEAMACGAIVVGYHAFGGREYFLPEFAWPVSTGDVVAFATALEQVLRLQAEQPEKLRRRADQASKFIAATYAPELEERELLAAWTNIAGHQARFTASVRANG